MGKFYITNNLNYFSGVQNIVEESEFRISFKYEKGDVYALATHKLNYDNKNYYQSNDDFLIATGTFLFNGKDDLETAFKEYRTPIDSIEDTIGSFGLIIYKEGVLRIFCDVMSSYDVFYYHNGNNYLISNSLCDIARVLKNEITVDELNSVEYIVQNNILGDGTQFKEIYRLYDYYLCVDTSNGVFSKKEYKLDFPVRRGLFKQNVQLLAERLKRIAGIYYQNYGNPNICMTGGLDARTVLAAFLSCGASPSLNYGVGNSYITGTNLMDLEIDKQLKDRFGLSLNKGDWSTPDIFYRDWDSYISKYGFLANFYGTSGNVMNFYESLKNKMTTAGYFGEMYRTLEWADLWKKSTFSLDEFIDSYYLRNDIILMTEGIEGYREHIKRKLSNVCNKYGLDSDSMTIDDNFYFLLEYRKRADTVLLNFQNLIGYSGLLLLDPTCLKLARIDGKELKGSSYMINVINELYPSLLTIPIYSHGVLRTMDCRNLSLLPVPENITDKVKRVIPPSIKNRLKKARALYKKRTQLDDDIMEKLSHSYIIPGLSFDSNLDKRASVKYLILIRTLEVLGYICKD